ncbi:MAG: hypothetical protein HYS57_02780 [Parcubacteria group bacterium]|nr:hypothetical protein [Parcubacteria group bacterium]
MFYKSFTLFLVGIVLGGVFVVAPLVFAVSSEEPFQLKIFVGDSQTVESAVNEWLAGQENIVVDSIKANAYGGDYAVLITYRTGTGRVSTRVKIIDSNSLTGNNEESGNTVEKRIHGLIASLGLTQNIRSADILVGSGPWDVFIVYDGRNLIEAVTAQGKATPIVEKIQSFIENLINPAEEQSASATTTEPLAVPSEEPVGESSAATPTIAATTTDVESSIIIESSTVPLEESPAVRPEELEASSEPQSALPILLAASVFNVADAFLFGSQVGSIVFLFMILIAVSWMGKKFLLK